MKLPHASAGALVNTYASMVAPTCASNPCTAGSESGLADFYVVDGACDWGNSLRAPTVAESTYKVRVEARTVDEVLKSLGIFRN